MALDQCSHCGNDIPLAAERCPHCALPGIFPNVRAAEQAKEREALNDRYKDALQQATSRGCQQVVKDFEAAISGSQAVISRSLLEAYRLASSDKQLYATFYQLIEAGIRLPSGSKWDALREATDGALFPGYKRNIRFAALSLDGYGLSSYGECFLVLNDNMIGHRASIFEENSVIFMEKQKIPVSQVHNLPHGYRAAWEERTKLCVVKLVEKLSPNTREDAFARILLKEGKKSEEDSFVEVHIWGPMTIHTFGQVIINQPKRRADRVILKALDEKLSKAGVAINVRKEVA